MEIKIEIMQPAHLAQVVGIERLCFSNPWSEQAFHYEITENHCALYLVALNGNNVVGYIGNWFICDEGHITNLAVHPDFQGRGIGKTLVRSLMEMGRQYNVCHFTLEVRVSNIRAQKLYKDLGFTQVGLRKKYYQDNNEDAIIMWKHID